MENLIQLWASFPGEVTAAIITIAVWAIDFIVTKTPNPIDNAIWRWYKGKKIVG